MLLKDLRKAIRDGELVDITGVKLRTDDVWSTTNQLSSVLHIRFNLPSVENKHVTDSLDVPEVSLSTKPKYDPCRRLREGDIVAVRVRDGRIPWGTLVSGSRIQLNSGRRYIVLRDENRNNVRIEPLTGLTNNISHTDITVDACYLELVTPVEELEPYSVHESEVVDGFDIIREKMCVMTFPYGPKEAGYYRNKLAAKEAAEDERDRLNAKWKREQSHG